MPDLLLPAADRAQRHRGRLHLWADRDRLLRHLQCQRHREFRPGRIRDARRHAHAYCIPAARAPGAGVGGAGDRDRRHARRGHRAAGGASAVGPQRHHVRDDPGDLGGADRGRAPDPDRRRRPAEDAAATHRPAAAQDRRSRDQFPVPVDRGAVAAADPRARPLLQEDADRQGDARLRHQPGGRGAAGHSGHPHAGAVVCARAPRSAPSPAC